jgi:predicted DNA-binding transcriptional regulator YafY
MGDGFEKRDILKEEIEEIFEESYRKRSIQVTLKFSNRMGKQLTEYFQEENIQLTEDNQFIVVDHFPYEEGLLKYILGFGKECEIIEPRYLRDELIEYVKELLLPYNG